jgi:hypothetical protein
MGKARKVHRAQYVRFEPLPERVQVKPRDVRLSYWTPIVNKLISRPYQWAVIATASDHTNAYATAYNIKHGKLKRFAESGAFEAEYRKVNGEHRVYARYIGASEDATALDAELVRTVESAEAPEFAF